MPSDPPKALEIENVSVSYGQRLVLDDVSLSLPEGETMSIVGHNGSGKSTLLKAIFNKVARMKGKTYFFGQDVSHYQDYELVKKGISYMVQGGLIFPSLTIEEHLSIATLHLGKSTRTQQYEKVFDQFNFLLFGKKLRAGNLSGGQRQILSLGILLAQNTRVWLLDEPTAGLAMDLVDLSIDFLRKANQKEAISIIMVEHNESVVSQLSHSVQILNDGHLNSKSDFDRLSLLKANFTLTNKEL